MGNHVSDRQGLNGTFVEINEGGNRQYTYQTYPDADVDVDSNNDGLIDSSNASTAGDDPIEYDEQNPPRPGQVLAVGDLAPVNLSLEFANSILSGYWATFGYDSGKLRLWDSQLQTNEIVPYVFPLDPNNLNPLDNAWLLGTETVPPVLWIEALAPTGLPTTLTFSHGGFPSQDQADVTIVDIDLDIDSDNNDGLMFPAGSDWEETLEDHPYGLGKLIMENAAQGVPLRLNLPAGLDPSDSTIKVRFDWNNNGPAGSVELWTWPFPAAANPLPIHLGGHGVVPGFEYSLDLLDYTPADGTIAVWAEGWQENAAIKTLAGVEQNGKPDERITATVVVKGTDMVSDEVKYLVTTEESFFYFLQNDQALRAALASRAVYTRADMRAFSMQILGAGAGNQQELLDLGVPAEIAPLLGPEGVHSVAGFNAALYQDFITGKDQYTLTFAGTDDLDDWMANIWQGLGRPSDQYEAAMEIAVELILPNQEFRLDNLVSAGHSLGGGLASAASVASGIRGFTFNAAGLHIDTLYQRDANGDPIPDGAGGFLELYPGSVARYNAASTFIDAYYVDHDILTAVQRLTPLPTAAGRTLQLDGPHDLEVFMYKTLIINGFGTMNWAVVLTGLGAVGLEMIEAHGNPYTNRMGSLFYGFLVQENLVGIRVVDALGYDTYFP